MTRKKAETLKVIHKCLKSLVKGTPIGIVRDFEEYRPSYAKKCTIGFFLKYDSNKDLSEGKMFYSEENRSFNDADDPGIGYFGEPIGVKLKEIRQIKTYKEISDTLQKCSGIGYFNDTELE